MVALDDNQLAIKSTLWAKKNDQKNETIRTAERRLISFRFAGWFFSFRSNRWRPNKETTRSVNVAPVFFFFKKKTTKMDHATALTSRRLAFVFFCQPIAVEEIRPLPRQTNRVIKKKKVIAQLWISFFFFWGANGSRIFHPD